MIGDKQYLDVLAEYSKNKHDMKIALIGHSTLTRAVDELYFAFRIRGINPEIRLGGYNTCVQDILNEGSWLYEYKPDLLILLADAKRITPQDFDIEYFRMKPNDYQMVLSDIENVFDSFVATIKNRLENTIVIVCNTVVPTNTILGIAELKCDTSYTSLIQEFNRVLRNHLFFQRDVFLFDLDSLASKYGKDALVSPVAQVLGDLAFSHNFLLDLGRVLASFYLSIKKGGKKCIVLDLDNTLWHGIVGEEEMNVKMGSEQVGKPYHEFQHLLLGMYNRGILLVINSKNNFDDAMKIITGHPDEILRKEHFAAMRINWQDKASNMIELSNELSLGLDSFVFFDDNPTERNLIKQMCPQVTVVDSYSDAGAIFDFIAFLKKSTVFDIPKLTDEDLERGKMYHEQLERQTFEQKVSLDEYLKSLKLQITITELSDVNFDRVHELISKTNQFNLTTIRYTPMALKGILKSTGNRVYIAKAKDRFGTYGIIGTIIMKEDLNRTWRIDSFLMSCRIIGKGIETAILKFVIDKAKELNFNIISGVYIPTAKNSVVANLYKEHGFVQNSKGTWLLDVHNNSVDYPTWIMVTED